jgi:hypothetical protein
MLFSTFCYMLAMSLLHLRRCLTEVVELGPSVGLEQHLLHPTRSDLGNCNTSATKCLLLRLVITVLSGDI